MGCFHQADFVVRKKNYMQRSMIVSFSTSLLFKMRQFRKFARNTNLKRVKSDLCGDRGPNLYTGPWALFDDMDTSEEE